LLTGSWAELSQRALQQIRQDLFEHLQELPLSFFDRNPAGELMSRLTNDIDAINQAVSQIFTALFASVLSMEESDRYVHPGLAAGIGVLLVVPIMLWFTNFVARYTARASSACQKHLGELMALWKNRSAAKVVRAFRRNEPVIAPSGNATGKSITLASMPIRMLCCSCR